MFKNAARKERFVKKILHTSLSLGLLLGEPKLLCRMIFFFSCSPNEMGLTFMQMSDYSLMHLQSCVIMYLLLQAGTFPNIRSLYFQLGWLEWDHSCLLEKRVFYQLYYICTLQWIRNIKKKYVFWVVLSPQIFKCKTAM